jgi:geranylgeranyl diphosphate synthase type II
LEKILPVFNQTALQVCEGQQFDMDYENRHDVTIGEYLKMVEYKTAVLLAAALKIGALCGGADEREANVLYEFGRNIGIAFQLQDDLLDVFADTAVFGKVTGNDIVSNKKTILLVEALNTGNEIARNQLLEWIGRKDFNREEKIQAIQQIYLSLHLKEIVTQRIQHYHMLAVEQLKILQVSSEKKNGLLMFSQYLMNREK